MSPKSPTTREALLSAVEEALAEARRAHSFPKVNEAKRLISEMEADPDKRTALLDKNHPEHKQMQKLSEALYAAAVPD